MLIFFLLDTLAFLLGTIGHRGVRFLSVALGVFCFDVLRIRRRVIIGNLDIVFGERKTEQEKIAIGRASTVNFIQTSLEFIGSKKLFSRMKVKIVNEEILKKVKLRNEGIGGIYGLCIHSGNWELLCHVVAREFAPVHVVVKSIGRGRVGAWVEKRRAEIGFSLMSREGRFAAFRIIEVLKRNEFVGFIVDQKRSRGERIPFFGKECWTNNSLPRLWMRHRSPIIPVMIRRTGEPGSHEIVLYPEFQMVMSAEKSREENITENTKRMNAVVEQMILANPEEYFWMHNRWEI